MKESLVHHSSETARRYMLTFRFHIAAAFIAALSGAYMIKHAGSHSLWLDEVWQIGFALAPFEQIVQWLFKSNHGIFHFFGYFWYAVAPYGERWLVLPSIFATSLGIYITALCGHRLKNPYTGILAAVLVGFSPVVMEQMGIQFRMYGFVFLFSALLLLLFLNNICQEDGGGVLRSAITLLVMLALSMNHLYGFVYCGVLFIIEGSLCLIQKRSFRTLWKYCFLLVLYAPILYFTYYDSITGWDTHSWMVVPNWSAVYEMLQYLSGGTEAGYLLLVIAVIFLVSGLLRARNKIGQFPQNLLYEAVPLIIMLLFLSFAFLFGNIAKIVGLNGTLWVNRYFTPLFPCAAILCALGFEKTVTCLEEKFQRTMRVELLCILLLVTVPSQLMQVYSDLSEESATFQEAADWLYDQKDIFEPDTLVLSTGVKEVVAGWSDYYLTQQGRRPAISILDRDQARENTKALLEYSTIYLQYTDFGIEPELEQFLEQNFELTYDDEAIELRKYTKADKGIEET